jgi:hypothetical protein
VGWFFGILFILFGLLLVYAAGPIAGIIVMFLGVLICYGGSRSGRQPTTFDGGSMSNIQTMEEEEKERRKKEKRTKAQQHWYFDHFLGRIRYRHRP